MTFNDVDDNKSTSKSSFSVSQRTSSSCGVPAPKTVKVSSKVTERHFTPRTRRLAIASKSHIRTRLVYHESGPFHPVNTRIGRMEFAWMTVKETANNSEDPQIKDAFKHASFDERMKKNLLTFVSHVLNYEQYLI